jgi:hypothetical protein
MGEHVAYMGEMRNVYQILIGNPEGKRPEHPCIDGRIVLEWILGN